MDAMKHAPLEWGADDPPFIVPEWETLLGTRELSPAHASQHAIALGGTGSGKTRSVILPFLRAAARYPRPTAPKRNDVARLSPALLVIDPKAELAPELVRQNAAERLGRSIVHFRLDDGKHVLHLFEGEEPLALTADAIVSRWLTYSEAFRTDIRDPRNTFFPQTVQSWLTHIVGVDLLLFRRGGVSMVAGFWDLVSTRIESKFGKGALHYDPANYPALHMRLLDLIALDRTVATAYGEVCTTLKVPAAQTYAIAAAARLPDETLTCVVGTASNVMRELASPRLARCISLNPFEPPNQGALSIRTALDNGWAICYQPLESTPVANTVGKMLKGAVFGFTFIRRRKERPVVIVCDEAHRFLDAQAEPQFIDRSRAYRAIMLMATQSVSSLQQAMLRESADGQADAALRVLLANCGSSFVFRTTDIETQLRVEKTIPGAPISGEPHIATARPVATLAVGECYYTLPGGGWGRRQIPLLDRPRDIIPARAPAAEAHAAAPKARAA